MTEPTRDDELRKTRLTGSTMADDVVTRFWRHVQKTDGCWCWTAALNRENGYGRFKVHGKMVGAHRFSYMLSYGPIPEGLVICHKCDNPPCVRPDHLFPGTHKDNGRDKVEKGRALSGIRNAFAKLTDEQVSEIRHLDISGIPQREIALRFSLAQTTVSRIVRASAWRHIAHDPVVSGRDRTARGERQGSSKLTAAHVLKIRDLAASGELQVNIARQFRIGANQISRIVHRKGWGWL